MGSTEDVKAAVMESKKGRNRKKLLAGAVLVLAAIIAYVYFGIISPVTAKPNLEKPLASGNVTAEQVNWVVNELGGYKLHASVSGEPAEIEVVAEGAAFSVTTENGRTVTTRGKAANPDVRLTASASALMNIINAQDVKAEILKLYNDGAVSIELLKDQATLALKGYKGIYDELNG